MRRRGGFRLTGPGRTAGRGPHRRRRRRKREENASGLCGSEDTRLKAARGRRDSPPGSHREVLIFEKPRLSVLQCGPRPSGGRPTPLQGIHLIKLKGLLTPPLPPPPRPSTRTSKYHPFALLFTCLYTFHGV